MRRHNFKAAADDDSLPVMVPKERQGGGTDITRTRETAAQALGRNLTFIAYDEESRAFRFASAAGT